MSHSGEDDDSSSGNKADFGLNDPYSSEESENHGTEPAVGRRRRRWERSEEVQLRECIERNEPWEKIGKQLDNRPESAAIQHWRLMGERE